MTFFFCFSFDSSSRFSSSFAFGSYQTLDRQSRGRALKLPKMNFRDIKRKFSLRLLFVRAASCSEEFIDSGRRFLFLFVFAFRTLRLLCAGQRGQRKKESIKFCNYRLNNFSRLQSFAQRNSAEISSQLRKSLSRE